MKKIKLLLIFFVICFSLVGCSSNNSQTEENTDEKVIFESTISPNEEYVESKDEVVTQTINIDGEVSSYTSMLDHCAIEDGSKLVLNYTNNSKHTVEKMLETKSDSANVFLGNLIKSSENQQTEKTTENNKVVG